MPRGRPKKTGGTGRKSAKSPKIELLVPRTPEVKLEEARAAVAENMMKPENIAPDRMPNIAGLDSYGKFLETEQDPEVVVYLPKDESPQPDDQATPAEDDSGPSPEIEDNGGVVDTPDPGYVSVELPKPEPKSSPLEILGRFNKLKEKEADALARLEVAETELEDTKKLLDEAISEKNDLRKEIESLKSDLDRAVKRLSESVPKSEYDKIAAENDNLILRNSELELENSIAKENALKAACNNASRNNTYSPPGYASRTPDYITKNTKPAMNGYQDWI